MTAAPRRARQTKRPGHVRSDSQGSKKFGFLAKHMLHSSITLSACHHPPPHYHYHHHHDPRDDHQRYYRCLGSEAYKIHCATFISSWRLWQCAARSLAPGPLSQREHGLFQHIEGEISTAMIVTLREPTTASLRNLP